MVQLPPHRVLLAGGGVAGLEALIALHALAGDRVNVTLIEPGTEFVVRALSVQEPFSKPAARRYPLADLCTAHGATHRRESLKAVDPERSIVVTGSGDEIAYDSLLIAIGARPVPAFPRVIAFRGLQDSEAMHGLLQDIEGGHTKGVAFIVPTGTTWPLPLYELAMMTAERASGLSLDVQITLVTPEAQPLGIFGPAAAGVIADALERAGAVAARIARRAGVHDVPTPSGPVIAAHLLTGTGVLDLTGAVSGNGRSSSSDSEPVPSWPLGKLIAAYLGPYLEHPEYGSAAPVDARADEPVTV